MRRFPLLALAGCLLVAPDGRADGPGKPAEAKSEPKVPAHLAESRAAMAATDAELEKLQESFGKEYEAAKTEGQRAALLKRLREKSRAIRGPAAAKVFAAVRSHAAEPGAVEALVWAADHSTSPDMGSEAAELLKQHHLTHEKTTTFAYRDKRSPRKWTEALLRAQLASPDLPADVRPRLMLALALVKQTQSQLPGQLAELNEDELAAMADRFGEEQVAGFRRVNVAEAEAEAVRLYREVIDKYKGRNLVGPLTFGGVAESSIFEIQHLSVGKTAPDIVGEDTDGKPMKLSDYRGKAVVLSFWGTWCGPCMEQVPLERELVARYKGKPFALVGVNSDPDRVKLGPVLEKEKITWRSFWCGDKGPAGDIPTTWNVTTWPTFCVLDAKGVIRSKQLITGKSLDRVIDKLVAEAEAKK